MTPTRSVYIKNREKKYELAYVSDNSHDVYKLLCFDLIKKFIDKGTKPKTCVSERDPESITRKITFTFRDGLKTIYEIGF